MKIITVINERGHLGFNMLRLSCAVNDLELIVLVTRQTHFASNRIKDELLRDYLEKNTNDEEVILFTDGNDAILMANEQEILKKFHSAGKDLVFSTETACWPDAGLASQYPSTGPSPYKYLNSGGFIGKAGVIRRLLDDNSFDLQNFTRSNQYIWAKRYFKYPHLIGLDTTCELFYTFSPEVGMEHLPKNNEEMVNPMPYYTCMKKWFTSNFLIQDGRIYSKITRTWPCQAHFNGHSKYLMDYDVIDLIFEMIPNSRQARFVL